MCYNWVIKSARFLRLPAAALAIADSGPVGKEGALQTMLARQVVLLTSSESFHPTQLPSRQQYTPATPLAAALIDFPASVADKRLTAWLSPLDATLTKNRGEGVLSVNQLPAGFNVPTCNSHSGTQSPLCTAIVLALSFHSLTNCPFSIPFVLTFMHRMGGVWGAASARVSRSR